MNKRIDFSKNGGFPATQFMTDFMQQSYRSALMALAAFVGDMIIVQGVEEQGGQVTNGWISYGGELIPFTGGQLSAGAQVIISETAQSRLFDDGSTHDVYFTKEAKLGSPGTFLYADLRRLGTVKSLADSLAALTSAFTQHAHSWNDILNRPTINISYRGSYNIGDLTAVDISRTIAIPDQGSNDYTVIGSWVGNNSNFDYNNDILPPNIFDKQAASFKIGVREINAVVQDVRFEFIIIKNF